MIYRLVKKSDNLYYLQFAAGWLPFIGHFWWTDSVGSGMAYRNEAIKKLHLMNKLLEKKTIVEIVQ